MSLHTNWGDSIVFNSMPIYETLRLFEQHQNQMKSYVTQEIDVKSLKLFTISVRNNIK